MQVVRYTQEKAQEWNRFVEGSKNGTLLFLRGYMDYHSDRFKDYSLMYYSDKGRLLALMAANEKGDVLYSHQGLTYGGLLLSADVRMTQVMEMFDITMSYLKEHGFSEWYYKQIPTCYHRCPAEEEEYALWRHGAELQQCLISTTIPLNGGTLYPDVERRRHRGQRKAKEKGYILEESDALELFWPIMESNLADRYAVKPVHTIEEIKLLKNRLPERIKCFLVKKCDRVEAGCIVYIANDVCVHIQYGHATPTGKAEGALDLLYLALIDKYKSGGYSYMDFGNSNEDGGHYLNENLIAQKEGFGGRGIVYKHYKIEL